MNTKKWLVFSLSLFFLLFGVINCSSNKSAVKSSSNDIPSSSKFAKIEIGMAHGQVLDIIGRGSDLKVVTSGKAWIPFYFGSDTTRTICYYKNEGRLVFAGGNDRLLKIIYDPTEDGYKE